MQICIPFIYIVLTFVFLNQYLPFLENTKNLD